MSKYDEYLQRKDNNIIKTDAKNEELFFKGYRPNFYFRTDDPVIEKPLSESIVNVVRDTIKSHREK